MDVTGFPTSCDIYLELDGRKVAVVQSYTAKATKTSQVVEAFGEREPVATINGQNKYVLELTTILIVDDVIPSIRQSLRSRFSKTKNTGQTRGAIRSQVIVELESKLRSEIIDSYGDVTVSVYDEDPTVCLVEFSFAVAHGLNQIYLTAHITI